MKFGFGLLAGLLAVQSATAKFNINISQCKLEREDKRDYFGCPCIGGSGQYDWHFTDLPEGWQQIEDKIYISQQFQERKIYGLRVQVFDIKYQVQVKKSLFFSFEDGKIKQIVDHEYEFDVKLLLTEKNVASRSTLDVKKIFQAVDGIGGGCGLSKLASYNIKKASDDDDNEDDDDKNNPYIYKLPGFDEVDKIIEAGNTNDLKIFLTNITKSKINCKEINKFLNKVLLKIRTRIGKTKEEFEVIKKLIVTLEKQIQKLQIQLKSALSQDAKIQKIKLQLGQLKQSKLKAEKQRLGYQAKLQKAINQVRDLEEDLKKVINQNKRLIKKNEQRIQQIVDIDKQISQLQKKINELIRQKKGIVQAIQIDKKAIQQTNTRILEINQKIKVVKGLIKDIKQKIEDIKEFIKNIGVKIAQVQKYLQNANYKKRSTQIKKQIQEIQIKLEAASAKLKKIKPYYDNLIKGYDEYVKLEQYNYNHCYKKLYKDLKIQFKEGNSGNLQFKDFDCFDNYLGKIFGSKYRTNNLKQERTKYKNSERIIVERANIYSQAWISAYGYPSDDYKRSSGKVSAEEDFDCDGFSQLPTYRGKILSIQSNIAQILNEKNQKCRVYLGGCTKIDTVNKSFPKEGDLVYWKGTQRKGKKHQYNAEHILCK